MVNLDTALTLDELCARARISKSGYRTLKQQGRVPVSYKSGRRVYFLRSDVEAWLASRVTKLEPVA